MKQNNYFDIDKITANDLSLESIYSRLNYCCSTAGEDFLMGRLYHPYIQNCKEFDEYRKLSSELNTNPDLVKDISVYLNHIGKLSKYSFADTLKDFAASDKESNVKHYIIDCLIILSFVMIFVYPGPGLVAFLALVAYSVSQYFKKKNLIAARLYVFSYIIKMLKCKIPSIKNTDEGSVLTDRFNRIDEIKHLFRPFMTGTFLISESARTSSNPLGIVFDYLRMIFHVDIIKYNSMIGFIQEHIDTAYELYSLIGELDCAISVNRAKSELSDSTIKIICDAELGDSNLFCVTDIYHPLIDNPVVNSFTAEKNILITGCNASGKSTFLKCLAVNAIISQCFGFAFAKSYRAPFYRIYSSMSLKDDLDAGESYFMAEIKSIKRIIDDTKAMDDAKILCVIDEVLRGTNTIERIAASAEILRCLSNDRVLCFAATHDIELTELLKDEYDNYHFSEELTDDDVKFSYLIQKGPARSRNAIRLLSLLGYDADIVKSAGKRADDFIISGKWN